MFKKIALGISGGVDSAVAALLLKRKGFDVHGVFMKNWDIADETGSCKSDEDYRDASYVCQKLDIPLHHVNFVKEYWNEVFCNLVQEYENGCTPNPDITCNKNVKFNYFYKYAIEDLKADAIATGHYACTSFGQFLDNYSAEKKVRLLRSNDARKDQTFFLCQIKQEALRRTMFPVGTLMKWEVKHIAAENGLKKIAYKPESMGICFIGSRKFPQFIREYIKDKPGDFIDIETSKIIAQHKGLHQWTLGQRANISGKSEAYFICRKNMADNTILIAQGTKHPSLHSEMVITSKPHWIHSEPPELVKDQILHCDFKFQHTQEWAACQVCKTNGGLLVKLGKEKRALTAGQYAVFYKDKECLGSAKITSAGVTSFSLHYLKNNQLETAKNHLKQVKEAPIGINNGNSLEKNVECNIYNKNKLSQIYFSCI